MATARHDSLKKCLGEAAFEKISTSKVLVVGAGGIGCELLKNLVLSGFEDIEIIDLDTIDVSNLNRQFLFNQTHVGQSKSKVARESALRFNPHAKIVSHHSNIKGPEFGVDFFKRFNVVMNALDNLDARRHVNRMCLAAEVPLIESGTAGYVGQVQVIKKGLTECYECKPKQAPKQYAVCTIRSNPSAPIHCVVWAKYLFERCFGKVDDSNAITNIQQEGEKSNEEDGGQQKQETSPSATASASAPAPSSVESLDRDHLDAATLFNKVFNEDISHLLAMKNAENYTWNSKQPPQPLDLSACLSDMLGEKSPTAVAVSGGSGQSLKDQKIWSMKETAVKFTDSFARLKARFATEGLLSFDKDDEDALDFVTCASNLRAECFHINRQSKFDTKAMAGNIIPAIATTNAIVAGQIVLEAFKVVQGKYDECRMIYCNQTKTSMQLLPHDPKNFEGMKAKERRKILSTLRKETKLSATHMDPPVSGCYVCQCDFFGVSLNTQTSTLKFLMEKVLKGKLGVFEPLLVFGDEMVEEPGDDFDEEERKAIETRLAMPLSAVGIVNGTKVAVEDVRQNIRWNVTVYHSESDDFEVITGDNQPLPSASASLPLPTPPVSASTSTAEVTTAAETAISAPTAPTPTPAAGENEKLQKLGADQSSAICLDESDTEEISEVATSGVVPAAAQVNTKKRGREESESAEEQVQQEEDAKRQKVENGSSSSKGPAMEVIEID